jgi:hypothetical protein
VGVRFQAERDISGLEKLSKSNKNHIFISRNDNLTLILTAMEFKEPRLGKRK